MLGADVDQLRALGGARLGEGGEAAAGVEGAAGGPVHERGRLAGDLEERAAAGGSVEAGQRGEEPERVGVAGGGEERVDRRVLDLAAGVEDGDPVGEAGDDAEVVGDQEDRGAGAVPDPLEHVEDLGLEGDVERGGGLVGDEEGGVVGEGHGEHGPLAHPAGELVRVLLGAAAGVGDADQVEEGDDPLGPLGGARAVVDLDRLPDLRADGDDGVQRREGVLEHDRDVLAADRLEVALGSAEELLAPPADRAVDGRSGGEEAEDGERGDGLPGPGFADDAEHLVLVDVDGEPVDGVEGAVVGGKLDVEVVDREQRRSPFAHRSRVGSKASRRPSPRKLTASTVRRMARPGK